jgi:hypothetical protein
MPRVKRGTKRNDRRKKILKRASGYFLTKSKRADCGRGAAPRGIRPSRRGPSSPGEGAQAPLLGSSGGPHSSLAKTDAGEGARPSTRDPSPAAGPPAEPGPEKR